MRQRKNIIVLLLDTLRSSDLGAMATLSAIARGATDYECAVSPGTWTAPAHASIFTERKVSEIREVSQDFLSNGTYKIDPWMVKTKFLPSSASTLASKMSGLGYGTALLSNNPFLTSYTNLASGFDRIYDLWMNSNIKYGRSLASKFRFVSDRGASARAAVINTGYALTRMLPSREMDWLYMRLRRTMREHAAKIDGTYRLDRGVRDTNRTLFSMLSRNRNYKPQFIFINCIEAHENYPVRKEGIVQDKWLYMSGIEEMSDYNMNELHKAYLRRLRYLDKSVRATISGLKENGVLDNATLVITSDHGQAFGEHNQLYHSLAPYEQISRVPLIAANYDNGKMVRFRDRVDTPVSVSSLNTSLMDLATGKHEMLNGNLRRMRFVICEHTGISEGWDEKLLRMLAPRSKKARMILNAKTRNNARVTAVYYGNLKLMHRFGAGKDELYDLSRDPEESTNIIDSNRSVAHAMAAAA